MTIVVFCPNLVGDTVMATPTLRALRLGFPDARILGVIKPHVAPTLDGNPWLDERILFNPRSTDPGHRTPALIRRLRAERPDLAVLLPNSFRSALLARLGDCRRITGYARGGRGLLLTDRLKPPRDRFGRFIPTPIVSYYAEIARRLDRPVPSLRLELFTTSEDERAADTAWERLGLNGDRSVVCLNTGGAFGPSKNWPIAHFAALAQRLVDEAQANVLVVCGPGERASARAIVSQAKRAEVVSLADEPLGIGLTKACVRRSALLITTDSGPRHFAAAFDVPVITLFGPTHIEWTRTHHPQATHLRIPVPCGPCQKPVCPLGHTRCMTDLEPDEVFEIARAWLPHPDSNRRPSIGQNQMLLL